MEEEAERRRGLRIAENAVTLIFDDGGKTAGRIVIRTVAPLAGSGSGRRESLRYAGMAINEVKENGKKQLELRLYGLRAKDAKRH